ncbi:hypothetical protein B0T25DRAFT_366916 [Lasiosphaeria hispida]|uniref:Uncharacterized protein n=1 Tax=Lasiosphaeria hispida TaxID=260671 RepID=A0AAJ0H5I8_9PEZI|nr:hypothetical protein B0T25DRAFT_366916 [Lasiosphaeria hispida]
MQSQVRCMLWLQLPSISAGVRHQEQVIRLAASAETLRGSSLLRCESESERYASVKCTFDTVPTSKDIPGPNDLWLCRGSQLRHQLQCDAANAARPTEADPEGACSQPRSGLRLAFAERTCFRASRLQSREHRQYCGRTLGMRQPQGVEGVQRPIRVHRIVPCNTGRVGCLGRRLSSENFPEVGPD